MKDATVRPPHSCFVERTREPGLASVRKALAGARSSWDDLESYLSEEHRLKGSFHFMYGPRYGWALRFDRSGRLVLAMYPNHGQLTVQIILGRVQLAAAATMTLPSHIVKVIDAARDYPEGKWLFIPVRSAKHATEIRSLIALKMSQYSKAGASVKRKDHNELAARRKT